MTPEQEKQYREDFEGTIGDLPLSPREERLRRLPHQSDKYFWNSIQSQWEGYLEARKKAEEEISQLKEQIASAKEIKQYPTALTYISELKEELRQVAELKSQLAKKDEIIKELKIYSDFLSQYSDCDDSCSWARHSSRCRSVTKRILDHKKKIEDLSQ